MVKAKDPLQDSNWRNEKTREEYASKSNVIEDTKYYDTGKLKRGNLQIINSDISAYQNDVFANNYIGTEGDDISGSDPSAVSDREILLSNNHPTSSRSTKRTTRTEPAMEQPAKLGGLHCSQYNHFFLRVGT